MSSPTATMDSSVSSAPRAKSFTRFFPVIARVLMGLMFFVFGLNGFLNFIPQPTTPIPERAMAFATALVNMGYMMQLIAVTMLVVGALLLLNRFVPLALVLIAPFIVNSIAFHIFLEPSGRPMAGVVLLLELYLAWSYRASYRELLTARATPA